MKPFLSNAAEDFAYFLGRHFKSIIWAVVAVTFFVLSLWSIDQIGGVQSTDHSSIVEAVEWARNNALLSLALPAVFFLTGVLCSLVTIRSLFSELSVNR